MDNNQHPTQPPSPPPVGEPQPVRVRVSIPTVDPILTYALLGIIAVIFMYTQSLNPLELELFFRDYAKINEDIFRGEYYRLFTSMFIHLDTTHLLFNGLALYIFGRDVESIFGHVRFAIIYVLGGLSGSVASMMYTSAPSIGASGAIFAIFAAMAVYYYHHRHLYGQSAQSRITQMAILAAINIFFGFIPSSRIDNAAHIGGLLGGIVLAWFMSPDLKLQGRGAMQPAIVDANKPENWVAVPVAYAVALSIIVLTFSTGG